MKAYTKMWALSLVLLFSMLLIVACSGDKNAVNKEEKNNEENKKIVTDPKQVTLKFNYGWEEEFNEDIKGPVEEKFPNIKLEFVETALEDIEEEIVKKNVPDIIYMSGGDKVPLLKEYELAYDLDTLIGQNNFDINGISQAQIDKARSWGNGALYYLPYVKRWEVLYYNKEIFDQFGVDYPIDGMTWEEVGNLAKKVTGDRNGVNYRGLDLSASGGMLKQLGGNHLDSETNEPLYVKDERFSKYLNMVQELAEIPGVVPDEGDWGNFINEQNLAMVPLFDIHIWLNNVEADTGLKWDMVSFPVWEDNPKVGPSANAAGLAISNTSEHKDEALQVLEYLLSEEWQLMRSKKGFATVLDDPEIQKTFSSEVEGLEEKNMQAIFYLDTAEVPKETSLYEEAGQVLDPIEFIKEGKDVNTYLREAYEKSKVEVEDVQGTK